MTTIIESGFQLVARVNDNSKKPLDLDNRLFPDELGNKQTVEINGESKCGKTLLLTNLIATCILPIEYKGFNINVLLIETDGKFSLKKLTKIIKNSIKLSLINKSITLNDIKLQEIVELSLKNLHIIKCNNSLQFQANLYLLPKIFNDNNKIGLIAIDNISEYYWNDREIEIEHYTMNTHVINILKKIQQATFLHNVKTIYIKQNDIDVKQMRTFSQNLNENTILGEANYKINLSKNLNSSQGICKVDSMKGSTIINYETCDIGIKWLNFD